MIRPTLDRIATWRRRERLAVEMTRMGANVTTTPEQARMRLLCLRCGSCGPCGPPRGEGGSMIETPWRRKAKALCAEMCADAWRTSRDNPRNPKRKKSPGYAVPGEASILIDALNRNDEQSAKAMFHRLAIVGVVDRP